ncbi:reverse transcriptase [Tanacetum coccineum]
MRFTGKVGKHELHVLTDCGSIHNFLDINVARKNFEWQLQVETFNTDMMILPFEACEMVLGIQWLATLSDIKCNYSQLRMEFMYKNKRITLRGTPKASMHLMDRKHRSKDFEIGNKGDEVLTPELDKVVQTFIDVFALPTKLPLQRSHDHRIPLIPNAQPVNIRPYRHPPMQKEAIEFIVNELLDSEVIKPSNSPFASPIVMDKFPIPIIEELIEELHGATIFSKLDLRYGYHQIRMYKDDIVKTAFKIHQWHYEFLVMPFRLTNSPSTFQALMNEVFQPYLRKFTLVFFDDILVYNSTMDEHVQHLTTILETMRHNKLFAKKSKCVSGTSHVEYLGHVISTKGVATDPSKISAMVEWPTPINVKQLRGFLRLIGYYRSLIATLVTTDLAKKIEDSVIVELKIGQGGHLGVKVTSHKICSVVYWKGLRKQVKQFVRECLVCQKYKPDLAAYPGLLQPLLIPQTIWSSISIDFIEGLPKSQNKNVIFVVVDRLSKLVQVKLLMSTSYHPQTDGQTKVVNRCLEGYLRCMTVHVPYLAGLSKVEAVDRTLKAIEDAIQTVNYHLIRAQNRMKQQADKGRTERSFEVGDRDILKLQPHRQVTVRMGKQHKFSPKFFGPFKVIAKIVQVAYHLELNSQAQIHDVFYVSQLKKHRCDIPTDQHVTLPQCDQNGLLAAQPLALLDRKIKKKNAVVVYELIQWTNRSMKDATWEPLDRLLKEYPSFDLNS